MQLKIAQRTTIDCVRNAIKLRTNTTFILGKNATKNCTQNQN